MPDTIPEINYTLDPSETIPAPVDSSLSIEGMAADAKATGDALAAEEAARTEGLAGKVSKSGDTMTGGLIFNTTLDLSNPTASSWEMVSVADKNNSKMALIRMDTNAQGVDYIQMAAARDVGGTRKYSTIQCGVDASGNPLYNVSSPAAFRAAIGAPKGNDGGTFNLDDVRYPSMLFCSGGTASGISGTVYGGVLTLSNSNGETAGSRCVQILMNVWDDRRYTMDFEREGYQADTQDEIWVLNGKGELVKVEVEDDAGDD